MPVHQRTVYGSQAYGSSELFESSSAGNVLSDIRMSGVLGAVNQINFLSSYCFEVFDSLVTLSDDIHGRVDAATKRTERLVRMIEDLESTNQGNESKAVPVSGSQMRIRYLSKRDAFIPDVLAKATSSNPMKSAYNVCSAPPRLWKMDGVVNDDCAIYYSNPGFFFDEWLRVEQERQAMRKEEQKREKSARNQLKMERQKIRRAKARKKSIVMESIDINRNDERSEESSNPEVDNSTTVGEDSGDENQSATGSDNDSQSSNSSSGSDSRADPNESQTTDSENLGKSKTERKNRKKDRKKKEAKRKKVEKEKKKGKGTKRREERKGRGEKESKRKGSSSSSASSRPSGDSANSADDSGEDEKKKEDDIKPTQKKGIFGLFGSPGERSPHRHTEFGLMTEEKKNAAAKKKAGGFFGNGRNTATDDEDGLSKGGKGSRPSKDRSDSEIEESVLSARERAIKARARAATKTKISQQKSNLLSEAKFVRDANAEDVKPFKASKKDDHLQPVHEEISDDDDTRSQAKESESESGSGSESDGGRGSDKKKLRATNASSRKKVALATVKEEDTASVSSVESSPSSASSASVSASSSSSASSSVSSSASSSSLSSSSVSSSSVSSGSSAASPSSVVSDPRHTSITGTKKTNVFKSPSPPRRERKSDEQSRPSRAKGGGSPPPPPPPPKRERKSKAPPPPPPPPVVPARPRLGSALRADIGKSGVGQLKKTGGPKQRASVSNRNALLAGIRKGDVNLQKVRRPSEIRPSEVPQKKQHAAISAILANRAKVAGSDSDDDSDSDESEISF